MWRALKTKTMFFKKKVTKSFGVSEKSSTFASAIERDAPFTRKSRRK